MKVVLFNGSVNGAEGNTYVCLRRVASLLTTRGFEVPLINLQGYKHLLPMLEHIEQAQGLFIGTGVYWDSWGSPLQKLLEDLAGLESTKVLFGKPAGLLTTCHSVGGKGVLNRLQGVANSMGLWVPPHGAMTYSMVSHEALKTFSGWQAEETWDLGDLDVVAHNVAEAVVGTNQWQSWRSTDEPNAAFEQRWLKKAETV